MRWHFQVTPPADGAYNMAYDEALMRRAARTGDAVFRVYGWSAPTLSLGRNQRARGCYDLAAAKRLGVQFVRRPTGGRALLHHHEVTYSVTMPVSDAGAPRKAYHFINDVLLDALARLGVPASRAPTSQSVPPGLRPCFDMPAEHEIVVGPRKLVGSAQWRHNGSLLQHGSILVRDDQPLIGQLLHGVPDVPAPAATLGDVLGREPPIDELAEPILQSLQAATRSHVAPLARESQIESDTLQLRATYEDDVWTWRR